MIEITAITILGFTVMFLAAISGGGGAIVLTPLLIALGYDPKIVVGTLSLAGYGLVAGSATKYRGTSQVQKKLIFKLIILGGLGSLLGPRITVWLPSELLTPLIAFTILIVAILQLISPNSGIKPSYIKSKKVKAIGYLLYMFVVAINTALSAGAGLLANYVLIATFGLTHLQVIATRRVVGLIVSPIQVLGFAYVGLINYKIGIILAIAGFAGSYFGTRYAIKKGNAVVKKFVTGVAIILAFFLLAQTYL